MKFEILSGGDFIRIEKIKTANPNAETDWDKNWLQVKVSVKSGAFSGEFSANLMTTDFEILKRDLKELNNNFRGTAKFQPLENQINLTISGDGLGHFEVNGIANDETSFGARLIFTLNFDQTELSRLIYEVDSIIKAFPIKGNLKISNE